jgi:hypothetical protein
MDETYVWQREDPAHIAGATTLLGYTFSTDTADNKAFQDVNTAATYADLARLMFVVTLKTADWWDVLPISELPVAYKFATKVFVSGLSWMLAEVGYSNPGMYPVVVGMDGTATFLEFQLQVVGKASLPCSNEFVRRRVKHVGPITPYWDYKATMVKHKSDGKYYHMAATNDVPHLNKNIMEKPISAANVRSLPNLRSIYIYVYYIYIYISLSIYVP